MSFEMNKIFGALLGAMILAMASGIIAGILVHPEQLLKPAYVVAGGAAEAAAPAEAAKPAGPEPIEPLLAKANAERGQTITKQQCVACHTFEKGQPNRIGPNLFGVFDESVATGHEGYAFSSALQGHNKEKWTPDELNVWLNNPTGFVHGTKMTFIGLSKAQDRADVIAYLDSLSDHPEPLESAAPAPGGNAPAANGGTAPPAETK